MRMVIVVPPHTTIFWMKITARSLATKHPNVMVLGPVESRLHGLLVRYQVPIMEHPIENPKPTGWWDQVKYWWACHNIPCWDPWVMCDVVMIMWDRSNHALDGVRKARTMGKKIWFVKMIDDEPVR